jgi:hypothetical protein
MSLPTEEQWRPIPGFEGYEVSNLGRIRSYLKSPAGRMLNPKTDQDGYKHVVLYDRPGRRKEHRVHRLVLTAFSRPPMPDEVTRHLNGDPSDNRLENLAWGDHSQNMLDRVQHGNDHHANRTHCTNGHEFTSENTKWVPRKTGNPFRQCRTCRKDQQRQWWARPDRPTYIRKRGNCPHCGKEMTAVVIKRHVASLHPERVA